VVILLMIIGGYFIDGYFIDGYDQLLYCGYGGYK
jgi:hypothetical protein